MSYFQTNVNLMIQGGTNISESKLLKEALLVRTCCFQLSDLSSYLFEPGKRHLSLPPLNLLHLWQSIQVPIHSFCSGNIERFTRKLHILCPKSTSTFNQGCQLIRQFVLPLEAFVQIFSRLITSEYSDCEFRIKFSLKH